MLRASRPVGFLDSARAPYEVGGDALPGTARVAGAGGELLWALPGADALPLERRRLGEIPFVAHVVPDEVSARLLGSGWSPAEPVEDAGGARVASVWRSENGGVYLPFDPDESILNLLAERYQSRGGHPAKRAAMLLYYRVRPLLPRRLQIAMRRSFSRVQARTSFPRWPLEPALHELTDYLLQVAADAAGEPLPTIAPWPAGYRWALLLTHDVEQRAGYELMETLRSVERDRGFVSSWNLVPRRYEVDDERVAALGADGCEVGLHGLYHDGRDLESRDILEERLPAMRTAAERWGAVGFRSPATHRDWELMPLLGFDYDSSSPDSDPFEPQAGGCCSWLPFFNGELVELPITLPQDHTVFVILRRDESLWIEKAEALRERGGMALLITHPDYQLDGRLVEAYGRFLDRFAGDETMWRPLPRAVAEWWRRRSASKLALVAQSDKVGSGAWEVVGPAANDAAISFVEPLRAVQTV